MVLRPALQEIITSLSGGPLTFNEIIERVTEARAKTGSTTKFSPRGCALGLRELQERELVIRDFRTRRYRVQPSAYDETFYQGVFEFLNSEKTRRLLWIHGYTNEAVAMALEEGSGNYNNTAFVKALTQDKEFLEKIRPLQNFIMQKWFEQLPPKTRGELLKSGKRVAEKLIGDGPRGLLILPTPRFFLDYYAKANRAPYNLKNAINGPKATDFLEGGSE
jgi:hypothetical protein